ncbi:hypothetical protein RJ640_016270 [Escallonia rubra]|uniref:GAG-pre-integrase domain-containing protein n=1 Tax=Escallonia rubra TaxID=112253 RepID=A0AA88QTL7_9ASTE|nr:hypothetical protein RJ640_016270 [Escallonia rubra]
MFVSSSDFKRAPSLATMKAVVEPVLRPRTTPDLTRDWFATYRSFDGGKVLLGNDVACKVVGISSIQIRMHDGIGSTVTRTAAVALSSDIDSDTSKLWHMRLGHMSERGMDVLSKQGLLGSKKIGKLDFCEHCVFGKQCRVKFSRVVHTTKVWILTAKNPKKVDRKNTSEEELAEHEKYAAKWENDEEDCRNYLLNCLSDELYDYYSHTYNSAKRTWKALQQKYDTEEAKKKKYAYSHLFNYKMSENVSVIAQTHDLQMVVHEIISEGIQVDEQMQVAAIIDMLPNSWREFQKGLRHKQSKLSIVNLMACLQIEEEARKQDKKNEALANNTHANHGNNH